VVQVKRVLVQRQKFVAQHAARVYFPKHFELPGFIEHLLGSVFGTRFALYHMKGISNPLSL
jgi:hypothetical protein